MYKAFFGLQDNPFAVSPNPKYLFVTKQIEEALSGLMYGIHTRKGFISAGANGLSLQLPNEFQAAIRLYLGRV